jgi:hypothetical protein
MESSIEVPQNTEIKLPYDPTIPLLHILEYIPLDICTCTFMFITKLFVIAKLWKHFRCPTTDEWIKKIWYIYTTEFYSAIKKNEIMLFSGNGWNWKTSC